MKKRRVISTILAAALLLSACGSGETSQTETTETNKNAVFKEDTSAFKLEEGEISQIAMVGDTLYVEQYIYNYGIEARDAAAEVTAVNTASAVAVSEAVTEEVATEEVVAEEEISEEETYNAPTSMRKITAFAMDYPPCILL